MKICVLMWYDDAISAYADHNFMINQCYCFDHRIEIKKCNKRRLPERHPAWERLPLILETMNDYDWVVWIDADAHFYKGAMDVREIIHRNEGSSFIFSGDKPPRSNINTGVFAVKCCDYSREFIREWVTDEEAYALNKFPGWWEQGVLIDMFERDVLSIRESSVVLDYGTLQRFYPTDCPGMSPLVYHMAEQSLQSRVDHSAEYAAKIEVCQHQVACSKQ